MKSRMFIAGCVLMTLPMLANASCDVVKSKIDANIKANGVSDYILDVVPADQADNIDGRVLGHCEDNKAIVYYRGQSKTGDGNSSSTPKTASPEVGKSATPTTSPNNASMSPPQAKGPGQTGG